MPPFCKAHITLSGVVYKYVSLLECVKFMPLRFSCETYRKRKKPNHTDICNQSLYSALLK